MQKFENTKITVFLKPVLNFTAPRYPILFSNSQNHIVHVIIHEWNRSMNVASAMSFVWDTKPDFPSLCCSIVFEMCDFHLFLLDLDFTFLSKKLWLIFVVKDFNFETQNLKLGIWNLRLKICNLRFWDLKLGIWTLKKRFFF